MNVHKKILLAVTILCALQVRAQWTADPAINTPVCTTAETFQLFPQLVSDENGGVFIVWQETSADQTSSRIFAQHLSAAGTKLWAAGGIEISNGSGLLQSPQIVADGNGGAVVSWISQTGIALSHYMQRVSSTGQILWTPGGILVSDITQTPLPFYQLIGDGMGGASLLWDDTRGGNVQIYAQHIDGAGSRLWADDGIAVSPAFTDMNTYNAVADASGGLFICFGRNSGLLNLHEVYVQHIDAAGIAVWGISGKNVSNAAGDQLYGKIVKDSNDHLIVVWQDFRLDPVWSQVYGQRIDKAGNELWQQNGKLLVDSVVPATTGLRAVTDTKKGVVITWFDNFVPVQSDTAHLFGIRIDSTGSTVWSKKELTTWYSGQVPTDYKIVPDFKGGAYINFVTPGTDPNLDPNNLGAQHIFPDGSHEFPLGGMQVTTAMQMQAWQQLMCDSNGLAVVAWTDLRSLTNYDLYAMRIGTPSTLPVTWLHFAGRLQGSSVELSWKTANEVNNKGFTIQRSSNGNSFDSIGYRPAAASYSFTDASPQPGYNYYRLQQTDIDGKISYSRVIRIDVGVENIIKLYPNPAREKIVVSGARPRSRLVIYDVSGRKRKQVTVISSVQEIYVHDLPRGVYFLVDQSCGCPQGVKEIFSISR